MEAGFRIESKAFCMNYARIVPHNTILCMNDFTIFSNESEFHDQRSGTIGSSDIPVLAGLYVKAGKTPLSLWEEKTGRAEGFSGNEATWWGHQHEINIAYRWIYDVYGPEAADRFRIAKIRGDGVVSLDYEGGDVARVYNNTHFVHPDYLWATAHPDVLVIDEIGGHIQEIKSTGFFPSIRSEDHVRGYDRHDKGLGGVPLAVYLQVQWQLFCAGITPDEGTAGVSVLANTSEYATYGPGTADPRTQEKILALAERFIWHVKNDTPPKPMTWDDVCKIWPVSEDTALTIPLEEILEARDGGSVLTLADMLSEREKIDKRSKEDKARLDEIKNAIGILMGENRVMQTPDGQTIATRADQSRESVSVSDLKKHDPELVERLSNEGVIKSSSFSVLRFKKRKG
jgi:hypothetical protein